MIIVELNQQIFTACSIFSSNVTVSQGIAPLMESTPQAHAESLNDNPFKSLSANDNNVMVHQYTHISPAYEPQLFKRYNAAY